MPNKIEKIKEHLELADSGKNFIALVRTIFIPQLGADKTESFIEIIGDYLPQYEEMVVNFMDGYYTEEEIDTMNEIYNNPAYKALLEKGQRSVVDIQPISNKFFEETVMKDERLESLF